MAEVFITIEQAKSLHELGVDVLYTRPGWKNDQEPWVPVSLFGTSAFLDSVFAGPPSYKIITQDDDDDGEE